MTVVNRKILQQVLAAGEPLYTAANRCTGRSTIQALHYIAEAIQKSGSWVTVVDHHDAENNTAPTQASRNLCFRISDLVTLIGLEDFEIDPIKRMIRCTFAEYI